jgi:hypothetical protein
MSLADHRRPFLHPLLSLLFYQTGVMFPAAHRSPGQLSSNSLIRPKVLNVVAARCKVDYGNFFPKQSLESDDPINSGNLFGSSPFGSWTFLRIPRIILISLRCGSACIIGSRRCTWDSRYVEYRGGTAHVERGVPNCNS